MDSPSHIHSLFHQVLISQQSLNHSLSLLVNEASLLNTSLSPSISTNTNPPPFSISHSDTYAKPFQWESHSPFNYQPPFHYHPLPTTTNLNPHYHHDQPLPSSPLLPLSVASAPTVVIIESVAKTVLAPELVYDTLLAPAIVGGKETEQELIGETDNSINTNLTSEIGDSKLLVADSPNVPSSQRFSVLQPPFSPLKPPDRVSCPPPPLPSKLSDQVPLPPPPPTSKPPDQYAPSHLHWACKVQSGTFISRLVAERLNIHALHCPKHDNALVYDFFGEQN